MRRFSFDLDALRTFVAGMELGSFAKAADRLGRSTSAVSAQLKKLQELADEPIFRKAGRGLALTDTGETMLVYARRMLELNDEAAAAVRGTEITGYVRLGLQEEFGEPMLREVLNEFARSHGMVRVEARVARNPELLDRIATDRLDMALVWRDEPGPYREYIADVPMRWIARAGPYEFWHGPGHAPVLIATSDTQCYFRSTGVAMLDRARIPWRHIFTSPNLSAIWSAVSSGRGVTIRTELGLPHGVRALEPGEGGLPILPSIPLKLVFARDEMTSPVAQLAAIVSQIVRKDVGRLPDVSLHARAIVPDLPSGLKPSTPKIELDGRPPLPGAERASLGRRLRR